MIMTMVIITGDSGENLEQSFKTNDVMNEISTSLMCLK